MEAGHALEQHVLGVRNTLGLSIGQTKKYRDPTWTKNLVPFRLT